MYYVFTNQRIQLNVVDADTKQVIQKNILRDLRSGIPGGSLVSLFKDGIDFMECVAASDAESELTIHFIESQITALGYNFNSITGNVITSTYDPESGLYLYPWIVNIYMSKL